MHSTYISSTTKTFLLSAFFVWCSGAISAEPDKNLSTAQRLELSVFGMKAMGLKITAKDVSKVPNAKDTIKLVATGINLNGHLCATIVSMSPLKVRGGWEVTCIANRGGKATKTYTVDTNAGRANEL